MEKKVKIGEREFVVRELLYKDVVEFMDLDKKELSKKVLFLATDITEEEWEKLSIKDGIQLQKAVNELNNFEELSSTSGFPNPAREPSQN